MSSFFRPFQGPRLSVALRLALGALLLGSLAFATHGVVVAGAEPSNANSTADQLASGSHSLLNPSRLSEQERADYYHLSQGADIFPLRLFMTLERPDRPGVLFSESLDDFGFLPDPERADCLPIGLTASTPADTGMAMIGFNCAACHVGQLEANGQKLRIDGGANMAQLFPFRAQLLEATKGLFDDPVKLWKAWSQVKDAKVDFCSKPDLPEPTLDSKTQQALIEEDKKYDAGLAKVAGTDKEDDYVEKIWSQRKSNSKMQLSHLMARMHMTYMYLRWSSKVEMVTPGPGRADAWAASRNMLFNPEPMTAPLTIPHLWNVDDVELWHVISNTNSILDRNLAEALAFGAVLDRQDLWTSARLDHLALFEELVYKIDAPVWPEEVLGSIDVSLASRGSRVYQEECAGCHEGGEWVSATNYAGETTKLYRRKVIPLASIGTDPNELNNYASDVEVGGTERPFGEALGSLLTQVVDAYQKNNPKQAETVAAARTNAGKTVWVSRPEGYSARRLKGVWATPPFLHNGSVPTLADLLASPDCSSGRACRPQTFVMGHRDYDTARLGFTREAPEGKKTFTYDTTKSGNSNKGHLYGTTLSASEKTALLEYLKTH